jgi:type I restriction enzyme S subunit
MAQLVDLLAGNPFKSDRFTDDPDDVCLVKGENVGQGEILWDISKRWPAEDWSKLEKFQLLPGDVVVAMDRPWVPAGLKWASMRVSDPPSLLVQRVARLRSASPLLRQGFIRCLIGSPAFENYVQPITSGVNVPHLSGKQILDFEFRLPSVAEQDRIVELISAYDDLIDNNLRRLKILEKMARTLYRGWFAGGSLPGVADAGHVDLPAGWRRVPLRDAVVVNPKVVVPREGEKAFVPMGCLSNDSMIIDGVESRTGNSGSKFQNGDTLFARITPCLENGKTGFVQFLPDSEAVAFGSTEFIVLRSKTLTAEFVYLLARSNEVRGPAIKSMSGASGRQRVREQCFDTITVVHPPADVLGRFTEIVRPMFRLVHQLHLQNQNLRRTRDLLLPRLMSGQLSLRDPNDQSLVLSAPEGAAL